MQSRPTHSLLQKTHIAHLSVSLSLSLSFVPAHSQCLSLNTVSFWTAAVICHVSLCHLIWAVRFLTRRLMPVSSDAGHSHQALPMKDRQTDRQKWQKISLMERLKKDAEKTISNRRDEWGGRGRRVKENRYQEYLGDRKVQKVTDVWGKMKRSKDEMIVTSSRMLTQHCLQQSQPITPASLLPLPLISPSSINHSLSPPTPLSWSHSFPFHHSKIMTRCNVKQKGAKWKTPSRWAEVSKIYNNKTGSKKHRRQVIQKQAAKRKNPKAKY